MASKEKRTKIKDNAKKVEKPKPIVFIKEVSTFKDAIMELKSIPGAMQQLIDNIKMDEPTEKDALIAAQKEVVLLFSKNMPDITERLNVFWQLTLSSNRCFLKTEKYIGFGWDLKTPINNKGTKTIPTVLKVISYNELKTIDELNYLRENGWTEVQ